MNDIFIVKRTDYPYCLHSSFYYNTTYPRQQAEVFPQGCRKKQKLSVSLWQKQTV